MIIHSPIFSGSITQAESAFANLSGSFTGSFKGVGDFTGLVADSVPYEDVTDKPTLVSGSSQVSYPELSNIPSGIISSSAQIDVLFDIDGLVSSSAQINSQINYQNVTSSIIPSVTNAFDLGSETHFWRDIYVSTGSIKFVGAAGTVVGTLSNAGNGLNLDGGIVANGNSSFGTSSLAITSVTGSLRVSGNVIVTNGGITGSIAATNGILSGSTQIASEISASLSAAHLNSKVVGVVSGSSQVVYTSLSSIPAGIVSGSSQVDADTITNFDTNVKAKLDTDGVISGSIQVSYVGLSNIPAGIVSGSTQLTSLLPSGVVSGSIQVNADTITNFDTNVKAKLDTDLVVSGSTSDVKTFLSLQNVTNESKATMFSSPTFTGTVSGVTATHVGLGNVTNESKATMFTNADLTGTPTAPTAAANTNSTQIATTAYVQQELTDLIGGASAAFDTLLEISASLSAGDTNLAGLVDGKLSKASNLSDLTDTSTARTNLGVAIGTNVQAFNSTLASVAGGTYSGDDSITTIGTVTAGNVTAILPTGVVSGSAQVSGLSNAQLTNSSITIGSTSTALGATSTTLAGLTSVTSTTFVGALTGNASTATTLQTARTIGGVSFNGSANIDLPGVNTAGNQSTSGNAATVTTNANLTGDVTSVGNATTIGAAKVTNAMLAGSIANDKLTNSTISGIALGSNLATLTIGTGLSGTSYNGSAGVTIANTGVTSNVAGTGVSVSGATGAVTISIGQAVATSSNVQFNSIGIGMAASATAGRIDATNDVVAFSSSDIRFKENITPIENALDKISKINGYTYDWKEENKIEHGYDGNDVGVIAQEIEEILPQLVQTRESGFKAVKYDKLVALLIAGMKEQQLQIEELKSRLS